MLRNQIKEGRKFTADDMGAIQQDVIDVIARKMAPLMTDIAQGIKATLSKDVRLDVEMMTALF